MGRRRLDEASGRLLGPVFLISAPGHFCMTTRCRNESVFSFSLAGASLDALQLLSMVVARGGVAIPRCADALVRHRNHRPRRAPLQ